MDDRATRLRALIAGESKVNDDSLKDEGVDLESDPPVVPFRYAAPTYDGYNTWLQFADTLEVMAAELASAIESETPYAPGEVVDLDTGEVYRAVVNVHLPVARTYAKALAVLHRLQAGESVTDALAHEGFDEDSEVVSEDSSALALDDIENNVIDFCAGVLLRRHGSHVRRQRDKRVLVNPGTWQIETY